jgi:hypothetical protein
MRRVLTVLAIVPLALAGSQLGQAQDSHPDFLWLPRSHASVGVTPGEELRISFFNTDPIRDGLSNTAILSESGQTVFDSGVIVVPPLQTVSIRLDGDARLLDGLRQASGRVQLTAVVVPHLLHARPDAGAGVVAGLELVDTATGKTLVQYNESSMGFLSQRAAHGGDPTLTNRPQFTLPAPAIGGSALARTLVPPAASTGLVRGELLRLTAFNPDPRQVAGVSYTLFSPDGTPVHRLGPLTVEPLHTVFVDVPADDAALDPFREVSGRAQLSVRADVLPTPGGRRPAPGTPQEPELAIGAERVDAATGRTNGDIIIKGKKID